MHINQLICAIKIYGFPQFWDMRLTLPHMTVWIHSTMTMNDFVTSSKNCRCRTSWPIRFNWFEWDDKVLCHVLLYCIMFTSNNSCFHKQQYTNWQAMKSRHERSSNFIKLLTVYSFRRQQKPDKMFVVTQSILRHFQLVEFNVHNVWFDYMHNNRFENCFPSNR